MRSAERLRRGITAAAAMLLLAACAGTPAPPTRAGSFGRSEALNREYRALARAHPGQVYAIDPAASKIRIYAFRGGAAAFAGHDHVLDAPQFVGYAYVPATRRSADYADARFDLEFRLADLRLDADALRDATGGAFAGHLSTGDIASTRRHLLSDADFAAGQYPFVELHSLSVAGDPPRAAAQVAISLHGQTQRQWLPLQLTMDGDELHVRGALVLRQSAFGVAPYSVLGGLLAVEDPVVAEFELVGKPLPAQRP